MSGITDSLLEAIDRSRHSDRRLSVAATGHTDAVRNIRRGSKPRVDTVEALCRVLGLELRLCPGTFPPVGEGARGAEADSEEKLARYRDVFRSIAESLRRVGFDVREPDAPPRPEKRLSRSP